MCYEYIGVIRVQALVTHSHKHAARDAATQSHEPLSTTWSYYFPARAAILPLYANNLKPTHRVRRSLTTRTEVSRALCHLDHKYSSGHEPVEYTKPQSASNAGSQEIYQTPTYYTFVTSFQDHVFELVGWERDKRKEKTAAKYKRGAISRRYGASFPFLAKSYAHSLSTPFCLLGFPQAQRPQS